MKKGEMAKQRLMEAAVKLIAERGDTEHVTLGDVAGQIGVPLSRIIYYYGNRPSFLGEVEKYILSKTTPTPIHTYLTEQRQMLSCREGQVLFVNNLFSFFRDFFLGTTSEQINYCKAFRALLHSRELPAVASAAPRFYLKDFVAFCEICRVITGIDDDTQAAFWYASIFDVLAQRLSDRHKMDRLDDDHIFSPDYDLKFLHYCRKKLMIELGLWETPAGLSKGSAK